MQFINKRGPIDFSYIAKYEGKVIYLFSKSEKAAKQKAIEYFRLNRKQSINLIIMEFDDGH